MAITDSQRLEILAYQLDELKADLDNTVPDVPALLLAANGNRPKLIICLNDPDYSTEPTLNYWNGTNLIVFAGQKRN